MSRFTRAPRSEGQEERVLFIPLPVQLQLALEAGVEGEGPFMEVWRPVEKEALLLHWVVQSMEAAVVAAVAPLQV